MILTDVVALDFPRATIQGLTTLRRPILVSAGRPAVFLVAPSRVVRRVRLAGRVPVERRSAVRCGSRRTVFRRVERWVGCRILPRRRRAGGRRPGWRRRLLLLIRSV